MGYYGEGPDVMGYGERPDEVGCFAEGPAPMEGYVREGEHGFSPRVAPVDKIGGVEGFITPKTINPTCDTLRPAERASQRSTEWFRPLW
jgi:hypothetical protein